MTALVACALIILCAVPCSAHATAAAEAPRAAQAPGGAHAVAVAQAGASQAPAAAQTLTGSQAPNGFAEYAWGTNPSVIRDQFMARRCRSASENRRVWYSLECRDYLVEGLNIPVLRLDFEPADSLAGYYMLVARASYRAFRDLMIQRFGPATSRNAITFGGAQMYWAWDGVSATLIERCGEGYSCVEVKTAALERKLEQIRERERRDSRQSF